MSRQLSLPSSFSVGKVSQLRKAFGISTHSVSVMATDVEDRASEKGKSSDKSYYTTGDESSSVEGCNTPEMTTVVANASVSSRPSANTETANSLGEFKPLAPDPQESDGPDKPVATYEFVWHYDHDPIFAPRDISQNYSESQFKELVQFYIIPDPWENSKNDTDSSDEDSDYNTWPPTHRAEVRIFRNNEKRVTFACQFNAGLEVLKEVKFVKSESISADGSKWPFFEDSRRLEDLDLRLRDERDENGYYYIEFIVRQKTHRDASGMPHLTVLGRRVVDPDKPLAISEEDALELVRRKTPEPYEFEEVLGTGEGTEDDGGDDSSEVTDTEEESETDKIPELDETPAPEDAGAERVFGAEWQESRTCGKCSTSEALPRRGDGEEMDNALHLH